MSVVYTEAISDDREGKLSWNGKQWVRTYTQILLAVTNDPADNATVVLNSSLIPNKFSPYPGDPFALATDIVPKISSESPIHWFVTIEYDSEVDPSKDTSEHNPDKKTKDKPDNPLLKPLVINFTFKVRSVSVLEDYGPLGDGANKRSIVNSVGESIKAEDDEEEFDLIIEILRNTSTFNAAQAWSNIGCVNSQPWKPLRGTKTPFVFYAARITDFSGKEKVFQPDEDENIKLKLVGRIYYEQRVEIQVRYPNWKKKLLNEGSFSFVDDGTYNKKRASVDDHGIPLVRKVRLDKNGVELAKDAKDVFLEFTTKRAVDFDQLPIFQDI